MCARVVGTSPIEELAGVPKAILMCQVCNDLVFAHGGRCNQRRGNSSFSAHFPLSYTASDASLPQTTLTWRIPHGLHR